MIRKLSLLVRLSVLSLLVTSLALTYTTSYAVAPTITDIADQTIDEDTDTGPLGFTVGDVETPVDELDVSGTSSNTALVPDANIVFGGSGASRTVTVTPLADQFGSATISLTVTDGNSETATDTFLLTVNAVNDAPTISDIPDQSTPEDTRIGPIGFTVGDVETPAASLTVSGTSSNQTLVPNANITFGGSGASRTVTVAPANNQSGITTITVNVSDGTDTSSDTFLLTVNAVNDAPTISDIPDQITSEDTSIGPIGFTVGDVETPAASLTVSGTSSNQTLVPNANITFGGSGASRTVTVAPAADQFGSTVITVTVSDGTDTANDIFGLTVNAVNDVPIADSKTAVVSEDNPTGILLTGSDAETCDLTFSILTGPTQGTLGAISNLACVSGAPNTDSATVTYTPNLNATGSESFTYGVNDGSVDSLAATVSITITASNDLPIADDKAISTSEDTPAGITLTGSDVESCELTFSIVSPPAKGSVGTPSNLGCATGTPNTDSANVTYTPDPNANGPDSFTYKVNDSTADSLTATVSLTINPINDPPTFVIGPNQIVEEDSGGKTVPNWATSISAGPPDEEISQTLTSFQLTNNNSGLFSVQPSLSLAGTLTFTPAANANGVANVTIVLQDSSSSTPPNDNTSDPQTFTITINPANDPPTALADPYDVEYNTLLDVDPQDGVLQNDQDVDGDSLTAELVKAPSNGLLNLKSDGSFTYLPDPDFTGVDTFTYHAFDGEAISNQAEVEITVYDATTPTVDWISPLPDGKVYEVYNQIVTLKVEAIDDLAVGYVEFYWWDAAKEKNVMIGKVYSAPYQIKLDTSELNIEWNQTFAVAYDTSGNKSGRKFIWIFKLDDIWRLILPVISR
jgi:hypothetical protein